MAVPACQRPGFYFVFNLLCYIGSKSVARKRTILETFGELRGRDGFGLIRRASRQYGADKNQRSEHSVIRSCSGIVPGQFPGCRVELTRRQIYILIVRL